MVYLDRFRRVFFGILTLTFLCIGCQSPLSTEGKRYASITGLKPDKLEYYKQLHAEAWPAVLEKIKECNIQNYSIYLKKIDDKYYLFSYFEYVGSDMEEDMRKMAEDPDTQRWWKETDPCQIPLPDAQGKGEIWSSMEEVFHVN